MDRMLAIPFVFSCLFGQLCPSPLHGEEVTLGSLREQIPVFTPDQPTITSFQFSAELPTPLGVLLPLDVAWTREGGLGGLFYTAERQAPLAFFAQEQLLICHAGRNEIHVAEGVLPELNLVATPKMVTFKFGITSAETPRFEVDLGSFLASAPADAPLEMTAPGRYRYETLSPSGNSRLITEFETSRACPLRTMEFRTLENDKLLMRVANIAVNQPVPAKLQSFPTRESFPKECRLIPWNGKPSVFGAIGLVTRLMQAYFASVGVHHPETRTSPLVTSADWEAVQQNEAHLAPILKTVLDLPTHSVFGTDVATPESAPSSETVE